MLSDTPAEHFSETPTNYQSIPKDKVYVVTGMLVFIHYLSIWNLYFHHTDQANQSKPFF